MQNTQVGMTVMRIADGALGRSTSLLQQMLTLATQAENSGSQSPADLAAIQTQLQQLQSELTDVANETTYNGIKLLDGSYVGERFQIGANVGDAITVSIAGATAAQLGVGSIDVKPGPPPAA